MPTGSVALDRAGGPSYNSGRRRSRAGRVPGGRPTSRKESPNVAPLVQPSRSRSGLDPGSRSGIASGSDRSGGWRTDDHPPLTQCSRFANTRSIASYLSARARWIARAGAAAGGPACQHLWHGQRSDDGAASGGAAGRLPLVEPDPATRRTFPFVPAGASIGRSRCPAGGGVAASWEAGRVDPAAPFSTAAGDCQRSVPLLGWPFVPTPAAGANKCFGIGLRARRGARRSWMI